MSVSTVPGRERVHADSERRPLARHRAGERVACPAFAAEYIATFGDAMNPPAESTLITDAYALAVRYGSAYCTRNTGPRRFTPNDLSHASGVNWPSGSVSDVGGVVHDDVDAAEPVDGGVDQRLQPVEVAHVRGHPERLAAQSSVRWASVSAHASALRLATTTLAPAATKPSAMARPIPRVPPVTIATRPVRSNSVASSSLSIAAAS